MSPDGRFGADPIAGRDALVAKSMDEAVAELTKRFGADMQAWKYGQEKYHHALLAHPLSDAVNAATRAKLEVGPLPRGGDGTTVSATGGADNQGVGRVAEDHRRHRGLGQLGRPEHARPVRRSRQPALSRSVRAVGARPVFPGRVLASEGRIGAREHDAADAAGHEHAAALGRRSHDGADRR